MDNQLTLREKINNAKRVDFGNVLEETFRLFKEVWLTGFILIIIVAGLSFGISFISQALGLSYMLNDLTFDSYNDFFTVYSSQLIYNIPQSLVVTFITFIFLAGFYKSCKEADEGKNKIDSLFYFFKKEYLLKIALLSVVFAIITIVAQTLFLIPYIYAYIPLSYFVILFAFNPESSVGEIVELSFILGTKKWFVTFGSVFVMMILAMFGIIACFIGLLFTISIVYLPAYFIYKEAIGFDNPSQIDA